MRLSKPFLFWLTLLTSISLLGNVQAAGLPDFTELAKENTPAVVNISTTQAPDKTRQRLHQHFNIPENSPFGDLFRRFFEDGIPQMPEQEGHSLGSGFIISPDGYILTNHHVIENAKSIEVRLSDRRSFEAEVIGSDPGSDVAVIKIDAKDLPVVKIGRGADLDVGEWVLAIGSPYGFDHSVTAGIVSAKGRNLPSENYVPFIQTDVAINPGNSGGPLINLKGEVVGINSQIYSRTGGFMGLSFSIPIELAMNVAKQLRESGSVSRGYLGVLIQDVDHDLAESFGLGQPRGALVSRVMPDTPAAEAGLQAGDIILSFNGRAIRDSSELPPLVGAADVNSTATMEVFRDGRSRNLNINIAQLPEQPMASRHGVPRQPERTEALGLALSDLTAADRRSSGLRSGGAVVKQVSPGAGQSAGIRRGDVIRMFNRQKVRSAEHLRSLVDEANEGPVAALVLRDGDPMFLVIRVGD